MRSIPAAMTWELLHRGRWSILLAIPGAIAIPAMIIMALRHDGLIDWREPSMLLMHVVLVQICALCCGASLFAWQGRTSRLYAYPIRSSEIVAWRLLPAMVIIALQMAACIAILNLLFDLHWPIFGPALIAGRRVRGRHGRRLAYRKVRRLVHRGLQPGGRRTRPLVQVSIRSCHFRSDAFLGPRDRRRRHHHARDDRGRLRSLSLCGRPQPARRTASFDWFTRLALSHFRCLLPPPRPTSERHSGLSAGSNGSVTAGRCRARFCSWRPLALPFGSCSIARPLAVYRVSRWRSRIATIGMPGRSSVR